MEIIAYPGLYRLNQLPPDFLNTLITLNPSTFDQLSDAEVKVTHIFKRIHKLVR